MVYAKLKKKRHNYESFIGENNVIDGPEIKTFLGHKNGGNIFSMPLNQLQQNKNMEFLSSGGKTYLKTKRGSTLVKDIETESYGANIYTYNLSDEYFVWADQEGRLKYCSIAGGAISTLSTALSESKQNSFFMYGLQEISALYGANSSDGMYKISGSTPTYSAVANSPLFTDFTFSTVSKRVIGVYKHTAYWSEAQTSISSLANLENFGWNDPNWDNSQIISPGEGAGFTACLEFNEVTCLFKDKSIWGLINADEATANWYFPILSSDTGTKSKKTVCHARYGSSLEGIIFLGTDKTLRLLDVNVERNSGTTPTLSNKNSHIISYPFKDILEKIPDGYLDKCTASFHNGYYILNIVSEFETVIDTTLVIDTEKLLPSEDPNILPQPYWFLSENMDFVNFAIRVTTNKLYGFSKYGYISELLVKDKYHEEMPTRVEVQQDYSDNGSTRSVAIEFNIYTAWFLHSTTILLLKSIAVNWLIEQNYTLTLAINSFIQGQSVPDFDNGLTLTLNPFRTARDYFDYGLFDVARFSAEGGSQTSLPNTSLRGNYFCFGITSTELDRYVTLYNLQPFFKKARNDSVGKRI